MTQQAPRTRRLGRLTLVAIGSSSALVACGPPPEHEVPVEVARPVYEQMDDCVADWGTPEFCETVLEPADALPGGGHSAGGGGGGGVATRFLGPYYSSSGLVYEYDGRTRQRATMPRQAVALRVARLSPEQIYATPGRYIYTGAHASAGPAKAAGTRAVARGGFGGGFGSGG
jgi:hypothetical protein